LLEKGVTLVTNVRKNMKAKAMSLWDRAMLSRRFIIETIKKYIPSRALQTPQRAWIYAQYDSGTRRLSIKRQ
jgi:hypothetical protein